MANSPLLDFEGLSYYTQKIIALFSSHTGNNEVHVTPEEKAKWNSGGNSYVNYVTTFNEDGSTTTTYADGRSEVTVFNEDGSILKTFYQNGVATMDELTVFNEDGSISVSYIERSGA